MVKGTHKVCCEKRITLIFQAMGQVNRHFYDQIFLDKLRNDVMDKYVANMQAEGIEISNQPPNSVNSSYYVYLRADIYQAVETYISQAILFKFLFRGRDTTKLTKSERNFGEANIRTLTEYVKREKRTLEKIDNSTIEEGLHTRKVDQNRYSGYSSFSKLNVPRIGSDLADRFYSGYSPTLEDLYSDFDVQRKEYHASGGIKDFLENCFTQLQPAFVLLKGAAGTGKTTLLYRIGYDSAKEGRNVFYLNDDWKECRSNETLQLQLKAIISNHKDIVILIDDIAECFNRNELNISTLNKIVRNDVCIIFSEQSNRWNSIQDNFNEVVDAKRFQTFQLARLQDDDAEGLVDKMITLENIGKLTPKENSLSREKRLEVCKNLSSKHLLVAMLQLRYGQRFAEIVYNEFKNIPTEIGKQAYLMVCFWEHSHLPISEWILVATLENVTPLKLTDLKQSTENLIQFNKIALTSRHRVITREICRQLILDKFQVHFYFKELIAGFKSCEPEVNDFVNRLTKRFDGAQKLITSLDNDVKLIEDIIVGLYSFKYLFQKEEHKDFLFFYARLQRSLKKFPEAYATVMLIINKLDPYSSHAKRQLAWIKFDQSLFSEASKLAWEAYPFGSTQVHLCQIARIISFSTKENFYKAKSLYEEALQQGPLRGSYLKEYYSYLKALDDMSKVKLADEDFVPTEVRDILNPSRRITRSNINNDHHGELFQIKTYNDSDPIDMGKYYADQARILQFKLQEGNLEIDPDIIKQYFLKSLAFNNSDPLTHSWLGTFYKDVMNDVILAESEYQHAISLANISNNPFEKDNPMFPNNLALLIMEEVANGKFDKERLVDAYKILRLHSEVNNQAHAKFHWIRTNLRRCRKLMLKYGVRWN